MREWRLRRVKSKNGASLIYDFFIYFSISNKVGAYQVAVIISFEINFFTTMLINGCCSTSVNCVLREREAVNGSLLEEGS